MCRPSIEMKNLKFLSLQSLLGFSTHLLARPYKSKRRPSKTVAIVVPLSERAELLPEEELSMRHLLHFLGSYDKYLVAPAGISIQRRGFKVLNLRRKFFGSAAAHSQLLMWPGFYRIFQDYEYILIYHLDSLVFSDEIAPWCRLGLDYIGAPWVPCPEMPWVKEAHVGNGGFALMKVESVLKVLYNRYRKEPPTYWVDPLIRNKSQLSPLFRLLNRLQPCFPHSKIINRPLWDLRRSFGYNNDFFWSFEATKYLPEFNVATVDQGLRFAFEAAPRICFELNGGRMPIGCHAWTKYDRSFWEPHLLPSECSGGQS